MDESWLFSSEILWIKSWWQNLDYLINVLACICNTWFLQMTKLTTSFKYVVLSGKEHT